MSLRKFFGIEYHRGSSGESDVEEVEGSWKIHWPGTVLASALLTMYLQALKEAEPEIPWFGEGKTIVEEHTNKTHHRLELTREEAASIQIEQEQVIDTGLQRWAEYFANDPHAGELINPGFMDQVVDQIRSAIEDGVTIDRIEVSGHASAEDDSANELGQRTAGLDQASDKNLELAEERSSVFALNLERRLDAEDINTPPIVIMPGVEHFLDQDEIENLTTIAQTIGGFKDSDRATAVTAMIEQYNRDPESLPVSIQDALDQVLMRDRKVTVTIFTRHTEESQEAGLTARLVSETERVSTEKVIETPKTYVIKLPWWIFGILPVFAKERRKKTRESSYVPAAIQQEGGPSMSPHIKRIIDLVPEQPGIPREPEPPGTPHEPEPFWIRHTPADVARSPQSFVSKPDIVRKMPRNQNFEQRRPNQGGRMPRGKGGDRSGKRG